VLAATNPCPPREWATKEGGAGGGEGEGVDAPTQLEAEVQPVPPGQLAALRREIKQVGAVVAALKFLLVAVPAELLGVAWLGGYGWAATLAIVLSGLVIVAGINFAFRFSFRAIWRELLVQQLEGFSLSQQSGVLLPLVAGTGEAQKIACSLMRDLGLPTELTPAEAPAGSGAEVSGTG
jgi:hypothetical protein